MRQQDAERDTEVRNNEESSSAQSVPTITLPKGGGAVRGIGEKFAANPVTGTGSLSIPIAASSGRSGFAPQLSLSYDSGAGNGLFGLGWNLSLPSITRKTDKGLPRYFDAIEPDEFILSGAEDLVPLLVRDDKGNWELEITPPRNVAGKTYKIQRYRPRIEGLFARIEYWTNEADAEDSFWRSISKDNITTWYGKTSESRIADSANPARIFSWKICESYDDKGNAIVYRYAQENSINVDQSQVNEKNRNEQSRSANCYLKRIRYGNRTPYFPEFLATSPWPAPFGTTAADGSTDWLFEVVFDYGEHDVDTPMPNDNRAWNGRHDPFSTYRPGFEVRTYRLCQRVLMFHHFPDEAEVGTNCLVRSTDFNYRYEQDPADRHNPIHTVLISVMQCGYRKQAGGSYLKKTLPPVEFDYSQAVLGTEIKTIDTGSLENLPNGVDGTNYQWVDLDGEGLSGVLTEQSGGWFYKRNESTITRSIENGNARYQAKLTPVQSVRPMPSGGLSGVSNRQFLDLAGDGQVDLVALDQPVAGFYERTHEQDWETFRAFQKVPNINWNDPNLKFIDLTGDGHADVLITEHAAFTWYASLAETGYDVAERIAIPTDEEQGPRVVFADSAQTIFQADLSGDGLTDIVRIRNGEVCYWPNLGYGYFGAKVTMDDAPWFDNPDQFDPRRIRLADIDGSGVTDIIYLGRDKTQLWFNQSGNAWSAAQTLESFPPVDNIASVTAVDLLGNGTACLVWSTPLPGESQAPMRCLELMADGKPHLMIASRNNLGAETRVRYAPSTYFYLKDKQAGNPWITALPFPVHVVERVETFDHISRNRFVTRYAYHHGYFDGVEREFRGFGMVEQFDTEEFAALSGSDVFSGGDNIDETSHIPPVHTKTWFHTGAYLGRQHISSFFAGLLDARDTGEYYREPGLSDIEATRLLLPDTVLPDGLTVDEERETCRALKGAMLRQEVYALDGTDQEPHPYTVTEQNFTIRVLQPKAGNPHGVFLIHAREVLSYQYERNPTDPRVSHALTLTVDDYGNVLQSAAIGYGRRHSDPALQPADQEKQAQLLMTCAENTVTNAIEENDHYRTPLPSEVLSYELTGLALAVDQQRFSFDQIQEAVQSAVHIDYHQTPTDALQKRVVEHTRTLYRRNDLTGVLALGELQSQAFPFESYQLAFTPEHLDLVFGDRINEAMLSDEGRYVHSENDTNWWIPLGQVFLSPNEADDAAQELAFAQQHFFLPHRFRNPFSQTSFVTYDPYDLLLLDTRDPLGNRATAGERDSDGSISPRNNYRMLQAELMTDPNGNRAAVAFDVLGLVAGTAVMGKMSESVGDSLDDFQAQLTQNQIDAFFADPRGPIATELMGNATSRIIYDETRFQRLDQPPFAATIVRERHVSDLSSGEETAIQVSLAYSDGFCRTIQNKVQAEPGPVEEGGDSINLRWTTSGWTIFNNKGKPVKQYEPFFSAGHVFQFGVTVGVSPTLFYDPVGRVVATLHPNHSWEKVIFDPWRLETWDVNDTVLLDPTNDVDVSDYFRRLPDGEILPTWHALRTDPTQATDAAERWPDAQRREDEASAAAKAAAHANTPAIIHFDSLGRPFLNIADNDPEGQYQTRTEQDIEDNPLRIIDHRGNVVMAYQIIVNGSAPVLGVDIAGRQLYENSMDAGERRVLTDIGGKPIRSWDSRGHILRSTYDELQRPIHLFVRRGNESELLAEKTVYGENHPEAESLNLRGQVYQAYDGAGVVTSRRIDFKGNLREGSRQLARIYRTTMDWSVLAGLTAIRAIEAAAVPLLEEAEPFTTRTDYDALNRPVLIITPDNSVTLPTYNEANLLEQMAVRLRGAGQATRFVTNIDYNARGQRELISYATADGTNFTTTYDYDPNTFRLTRLHTMRHRDNRNLQDLNYVYDPAGNITSIRDNAQQTVFFDNAEIEPHCEYTYDALYRLIQAEGREHAVQNNIQRDAADFEPVIGIPFANSPQALQRYIEEYAYDGVGNILSMTHTGGAVQRWKRCYQYAQDSNRLLATGGAGEFQNVADPCPAHYVAEPTLSQRYQYDVHGNMIQMPHLPQMQWDFKDQLQVTSRQVVNEGIPETTYYVYDAAGERVRKVTERMAGRGEVPTRMNERIYLGGVEVYREYDGSGTNITLERETLHVMDDSQRVALVETRTQGSEPDAPQQLIRYQLGNHLGSASLELDDNGAIISYEEYHPYGTSAYRAGRSEAEVSLKRYRYTGKERDEETGLYYHGARYYAGWLGRWTACDPVGIKNGHLNLFQYVSNNPSRLYDPTGRDGKPPPASKGFLGHAGDLASGLWLGAKETVVGIKDLAVGSFNTSILGSLVDPEQYEKSTRKMNQTTSAIWDDPTIVWEAIKEPYEKAWEEGRPGEAVGRGIFEAISFLVGTKGADKAAKGSKLGTAATKVDDLANAAKVGNKVDDAAKVGNKVDDTAKAGSKVDNTAKNLEGVTEYDVYDPKTGDRITDIDNIEAGVLWEEKTAGDYMVTDPDAWANKHLIGKKGKIQKYIEARKHMTGYEDAPIGIDFTNPNVTPEFKAAVEQSVDALRKLHPNVDIRIRWR